MLELRNSCTDLNLIYIISAILHNTRFSPQFENIHVSPGRPFAGLDNEPYFDYWHVFVHYCSSDVWSGSRAASQETGGYNFYGKHIVSAVLEDLSARFGLLEASHIVLTGGSAGAQGTVLNCDDFSAQVWAANPDIDVR